MKKKILMTLAMAIISIASFANSKKTVTSTTTVETQISQMNITEDKSDNDKSLEQISRSLFEGNAGKLAIILRINLIISIYSCGRSYCTRCYE